MVSRRSYTILLSYSTTTAALADDLYPLVQYIVSSIRGFDEIKRAILFGSRAKGNFKAGSDIDIAIVGEEVTITNILLIKS